jgi:hypothetical protein
MAAVLVRISIVPTMKVNSLDGMLPYKLLIWVLGTVHVFFLGSANVGTEDIDSLQVEELSDD